LRILCITWSPKGSRRMHDLRSLLGAEIWNYSIFYKVKALSIIKYPFQAIMTFRKLLKTQPDVVVVQNPPIFAPLTCLIYSKFYTAKIVIDHHLIWSMSGFINNPILKSAIRAVEEFCVKEASLNTTYSDDWEHELTEIGAKNALTIYDFVDKTWVGEADLSIREKFPKDKKIIVMACGTGHSLEHPDLLIESSKDLSNLVTAITGDSNYLRAQIDKARNLGIKNVIFTGFLRDREYRGLIATCDFVANISDEPYGIPHTITEGLAAGRPVITSGNPSIRKLLGQDYSLIVPHNDIENIRKVISIALKRQEEFKRQANRLYMQLKEKRERQLERLLKFLDAS